MTRKLIAALKTRWPDKLVVLGGAHCNVAKDQCLEDCSDLDVAVFGEGEVTLCEVVERFENGTRDFSGIGGCSWRQGNGSVIRENKRALSRAKKKLPY